MKPYKFLLTLNAALLGTAAIAAELPKEGKFTGTYHAKGTWHGA